MRFILPDFLSKRAVFQNIDPELVIERQRFVVYRIFSVTTIIVCLGVFSKMVLTLSHVNWLPYFVLFLGSVILINYLRIRKPSELPGAYLIMLLSALIVLHCVAYTCGGIRTGGTFFMTAVIIYAFMLLGKKGGWLIAGLAALHISFMFVISTYTDWTSFSLFDDRIDLINEDFLTNILLTFFLISALSSYLQSNRNVVIRKVIESKKELEKMNQELVERNQSLEKKNAELDKFASVASHDLRAPLRAIGSLTDMILEDELNLSFDSQEKLQIIRKRTHRMDHLLSALLDYSRVDRNLKSMSHVDVKSLLVGILSKHSEGKDISFSISEGLPVIYTSALALERVFNELINNAIKFNNKEKVKIEIAGHQSNNKWQFSVKDNGPGIGSSFKDKVFVIFQTLEARDKFESTGAGLAIARKLVQESKGEIWLSSEQEQGVTFHFTWQQTVEPATEVQEEVFAPLLKLA
ncbi:MAG: ATP-binding protein [Bacteroidia bacterium]